MPVADRLAEVGRCIARMQTLVRLSGSHRARQVTLRHVRRPEIADEMLE